jgi:hypothetical protein
VLSNAGMEGWTELVIRNLHAGFGLEHAPLSPSHGIGSCFRCSARSRLSMFG